MLYTLANTISCSRSIRLDSIFFSFKLTTAIYCLNKCFELIYDNTYKCNKYVALKVFNENRWQENIKIKNNKIKVKFYLPTSCFFNELKNLNKTNYDLV